MSLKLGLHHSMMVVHCWLLHLHGFMLHMGFLMDRLGLLAVDITSFQFFYDVVCCSHASVNPNSQNIVDRIKGGVDNVWNAVNHILYFAGTFRRYVIADFQLYGFIFTLHYDNLIGLV